MRGSRQFEDIDAALAEAFREPEVNALVNAGSRRKREKRMGLSNDGRRARATGRTRQFNCKMKPDLHRRLVQASRTVEVAITVLVERAVGAILARLDGESPDEVLAVLDGEKGRAC
jgi:hypothetical protein